MARETLFPPAYADANLGPGIIAGNLTVAIIANIAVMLRFWARSRKGGLYGIDDWLILLALPFGWGMAIATIICVRHGLGRHIAVVMEEDPGQLLIEGKVRGWTGNGYHF